MAKNAGESRIPLPRTVRPSLLPKPRSYGSSKISPGTGHRRSPVYCSSGSFNGNNKQQQIKDIIPKQQQKLQQQQTKAHVRTTPDKDQDNFLDADYTITSIWNSNAENKEADQLMRLNEDKLGILRSQEDLANFVKKKQQQQQQLEEEVVSDSERLVLVGGESPVSGTTPHYLMLTKQNSFEHDESLGILTPDQMTDFTVALESSRTPSCENLSGHTNSDKFLFGKSNATLAAAVRHFDITARVPSLEAFLLPNDRSPSVEELPLDPKPSIVAPDDEDEDDDDVNLLQPTSLCSEQVTPRRQNADTGDLSKAATAIDSSETSEQTRCSVGGGGVAGVGHILPTSFITSVTSITSLEAGYQGDGENSRPASRGPEPVSIVSAANLIVSAACKQDPMTDSDFFTESDVDAHEEIIRGDRRAQVIDGTLFCAPNERRCPSFERCEEMDSSGIYSDLDKRQDSVGMDGEGGYGDGDHTTDTGDTEVSMKSQLSPQEKMPVTALVTKNILSPQDIMFNESKESGSSLSTAEVTVIKCQKNEQNAATKSKSNSISNKENAVPLKKYKMPKRNVISKIKTMIESNQNIAKDEPENELRRPQRQQRKNGRWDAVMNKIEAGKQRGRSLKKEVKSRVLHGLGTSTSSTASTSSTRRPAGDANNNANNNKDKRRVRGRMDMNSPNQETARSSVRSSASDLSSAHSKETQKRPTRKNCTDSHQPNNQQFNSNINKSNISTVRKAPSIKSVQSSVNAKQKNATTNKVAERNTTNTTNTNNRTISSGKDHGCNNGPILNNHRNNNNNNNISNNNNNNNNNHNNNNNNINHAVVVSEAISSVPAPQHQFHKLGTREQEIQTELHIDDNDDDDVVDLVAVVVEKQHQQLQVTDEAENSWRKKAEDTIQALAITVQYFTRQLEDVPNCRLKKELDKMKSEWLSTSSELEELRLRKASIEDAFGKERDEHLKTIESLREDLKCERAGRLSLEQSVQESQRRAHELQELLQERERELGQARTLQVAQDQGALFAEVESLRTVLEIRSQENAQLRSEVDLLRRELDEKEVLKQKCDGLEARCEDLKAQLQSKETFERQLTHDNEVLMGSIHQMSKQNKRLSQRNEELLWRLRQKNEVVSVLTNQLTPPSQRLSKSLGPEHTDHPSTDCSQKSEQLGCSMVKYMVEKGDSVSWTLDITESMESSGNNSSNYKTPSPSLRRYHENNGTLVSRQGSLRLPMTRRANLAPSRARSNSVSVAESARKVSSSGAEESTVWNPSYNSTPLQRRRNNVPGGEKLWSLSNTVPEAITKTCSVVGGGGGNTKVNNSSGTKLRTVEVSTTDEDEEEEDDEDEDEDEEEEEVVGQRPQEAGGEAMISEETSASSSNEDDESSVSSGDIP